MCHCDLMCRECLIPPHLCTFQGDTDMTIPVVQRERIAVSLSQELRPDGISIAIDVETEVTLELMDCPLDSSEILFGRDDLLQYLKQDVAFTCHLTSQ